MYKSGTKYKVLGFNDHCPSSYSQKLLCIGFVPGQVFTINRVAPLGDPLEIMIKGAHVSLRKSEFGMIQVEKI
jgi:ferrous iron transport protein A